MEPKIIIVGGGIAGLTCAWRLQQAGLPVQVFEADRSAGGNVRTDAHDGFLLERGPHTFMASADDIFALAAEVDLTPEITPSRPAAHKRFIARQGRLHAIPSGAWSFVTSRLLSFRGKLTLIGEPFRTRRGEPGDTAMEFFTRRFGPEAARVLAGAFVSGVYGGDPDRLSAPAAFGLFWRFEQESGGMIRGAIGHMRRRKRERLAKGTPKRAGLYSFRRGLGQLTEALAGKLGERLVTGAPVRALARHSDGGYTVRTDQGTVQAPQLILAVPPPEAARLLGGIDPTLAGLLTGIPMSPMAVVYQGYAARAERIPEGFGFLVPRGEGIRTLGILFPSRLFDGRTPAGGDLVTGYVGGMLDPGALALPDPELQAIVDGELGRLTGNLARPAFVRVARHPAAIPQFALGHLARMAEVQGRLGALPGLRLTGNYLRGVGMKDAVGSAIEVAAQAAAAGRS